MRIYVHIPFCHSKCAYCDFYSTPRHELMEQFTNTLEHEWKLRSEGLSPQVESIYLGGGTPSSLPTALVGRIFSFLPPTIPGAEVTIEANPEDITTEWIEFITTNTPVNRVSMGIQSFDDPQLALIGRRHSAQDAENAYHALYEGGIENISCDLIYGLPGQDLDSWRRSLDRLLALHPAHISAYILSYEPGTRLHAMLDHGKVAETDDDTIADMYTYLCDATRAAGYLHYEISNFAIPSFEAAHNSGYWSDEQYIGLGPGAHSYLGYRSYNPPDLKKYISSGAVNFNVMEEENEKNRFNDMLITSLRTADGLDMHLLGTRFQDYLTRQLQHAIKPLISRGDLRLSDDGRLTIPENRWLMSNAILLELITV